MPSLQETINLTINPHQMTAGDRDQDRIPHVAKMDTISPILITTTKRKIRARPVLTVLVPTAEKRITVYMIVDIIIELDARDVIHMDTKLDYVSLNSASGCLQ